MAGLLVRGPAWARLRLALGFIVYALVLLFFASWCTAHALLFVRLLRLRPRLALVGLLAAPLAPYFGYELGLRRLSLAWVVCATGYVVTLLLGLV